jgi:hypothetical protein
MGSPHRKQKSRTNLLPRISWPRRSISILRSSLGVEFWAFWGLLAQKPRVITID